MLKAKVSNIGGGYRVVSQINTCSWALPLAIHWIGHSDQEDLTIHFLAFKINIFKYMLSPEENK